MVRLCLTLTICVALEWVAAPAQALAQSDISGCRVSQVQSILSKVLENKNHIVLDGTVDSPVQIDCDEMQFFADHVEYFKAEGRVLGNGHVLFVTGGNRISAERMEFDTKTRTGTFYIASGTAVLRDKPDPSLFGGQEPDLMFRGEEVHKLGPKKYRIVRGGFTTCVQPTPRWEMSSGSITLVLDDYAFLKGTLFKVKNVPLMYLPAFYYPIQEDNRSTGFLMPVYGGSTVKGQAISNAFFWAINRSHDATLYHDWFSKAGQQIGGDYNYVLAPGSQGSGRMSMLNEHEVQTGSTAVPASTNKSYTISGNLTQRLPAGMYARGSADYFSSVSTQQRYEQDIYRATRNRRFGGNIAGSWQGYSLSATVDRADYFSGEKSFTTNGNLPRISFSRAEKQIPGLPIYFGVNSDFVTIERSQTDDDVKDPAKDVGLTKLEVNPSVRVPFTRWPFLTINSAVSWRGTYWTESLDPDAPDLGNIQEPIGRRYFDLQSRITGPVFNRIWNTPGNGYAEKFKHVIEPSVVLRRVTAIDNRDRIQKLEGSDYTFGSVTEFRYGLSNRVYAKKERSREILSATISQSYYTDAQAAQFDPQQQSSTFNSSNKVTKFSAVTLQVRGAPTDRFQTDFRTEWDPTAKTLKTLAANGSISEGWLQATAGWSRRRFIPGLRGFDNEAYASNYLNASATVRPTGSRIGGAYTFNYDLKNDSFLQQRFTTFYNAQCCGIAIEYQTFNLQGSFAGSLVPQDRRFNLSFTLAGIGTFSNLFGAFGGGQGRR